MVENNKKTKFFFEVIEKMPKEMISISEWLGKHQFAGQNTQQTCFIIFFYKNEGTIFIYFTLGENPIDCDTFKLRLCGYCII